MKSLSKIGKIYFAGAIVLALVFLVSTVMFAVSCVFAGRHTDLGCDFGDRDVVKLAIGEDGSRIAGARDGSVFAFGADGELLWDAGRLGQGAVYDIKEADGKVYVVYASGYIYEFSQADARAFAERAAAQALSEETLLQGAEQEEAALAEEGNEEFVEEFPEALSEEFPEELAEEPAFPATFKELCTEYATPDQIGGGVSNTELMVGDGEFYLRGIFNDGSNHWYLFRFTEGDAEPEQIRAGQGSRIIGGMALIGDDLYYSYRGDVYVNSGKEAVYHREQDVIALSASEEELYLLMADGILVSIRPGGEELFSKELGLDVDTSYAFSTGENFLVKVRNGGVAYIGSEAGKVTLRLNASDKADFILWTDDFFALRDGSDITNPFVVFYAYGEAKTAALYQTLRWVFLAMLLVSLLGGALCAFAVTKKGRKKIAEEAVSLAKALKKHWSIYLALVIPFALLITFYYIPIVLGFSISFMDYTPGVKAVFEGFRYYGEVFSSTTFWNSTMNMVLLLIADLLKALIPPFIIAEIIVATRLKRFSLWVRILLFLPGILPGVATTLVWMEGVFGADGTSLFNALVKVFAPSFTAMDWLHQSVPLALFSIICFGFPWVGSYLIFYGALGGISSSIFEAAKLDGCSWWRRVLRIDIPMILSQFKYVLITSFIASVQNYGTIYILYGAADTAFIKTPALLIYGRISTAQYNTASVMGVFLFLILAAATIFNFRSQREQIE